MRKVFHIFFRAEGTRPFLVLFALLLAALCEAIGISALLPAVAIIAEQPAACRRRQPFEAEPERGPDAGLGGHLTHRSATWC